MSEKVRPGAVGDARPKEEAHHWQKANLPKSIAKKQAPLSEQVRSVFQHLRAWRRGAF
jgi:hypothetical protein